MHFLRVRFCLFALLIPLLPTMAQWHSNPPLSELLDIGLPVIAIKTTDGEEPTYSPVDPPEGAFGRSIKAKKVTGSMMLLQGNDTLYDSGSYEKGVSGITIKVRGNTSAYVANKPYKIKLQKKADLLCRGNDDKYEDKEWLLIEGNKLVTMVGVWVSEFLEMPWTPSLKFVNVVMNGQYRGLYLLIESVKRNANCRLDVDERTGYIFEQDAYWWNTDYFFKSKANHYFTLKYPDDEDATDSQKQYICSIVDQMEMAINDGTYDSYIDVPSFARWVLAHDILGSYDAAGSNIYFAKYDDTNNTKITMPLIWDFDCIMSVKHEWSRIHTSNYSFFPLLFHNSNGSFIKAYAEVWNQYSKQVFDGLDLRLQDFLSSELRIQLECSREKMKELLDFDDWTWIDDAQYCANWFREQYMWLENAIPIVTSLTFVENHPQDTSTFYDLTGRRISIPSVRGVYVYHGKKYVKTTQ